MNSFINIIEKLFFPWDTCCNGCKSEKVYQYGLCENCFRSLTKPEGSRCEICLDKINTAGLCKSCLEKKPDYICLYCAFLFENLGRKLIHEFKFRNKRYLKHLFAALCAEAVPKEIWEKCTLLIPVPLSKKRYRQRGYNQAELLARELSIRYNIPVNTSILYKHEGEKQMALLNKEERRKNIKGLYAANGTLKNQTVLLIDDIVTTGETLRACAAQLKKAGAEAIYCLAIARTDIL